jgi:hypothetical protein
MWSELDFLRASAQVQLFEMLAGREAGTRRL